MMKARFCRSEKRGVSAGGGCEYGASHDYTGFDTGPVHTRTTRFLGWVVVGLSVAILLVFASFRLAGMAGDPATTDAFGIRYVEHPGVALLHIIPGLLFLTLAPLQFVSRIRERRLSLHRQLGRVLATCAAISGLFALVAAFRLPAFGGINTLAATVFFGSIFLFALTRAIQYIRRKAVPLHREWMIRTFALATGVASIRVCIAVLTGVFGFGLEEIFGTSFWLGFGVNLLVAEVWINYTRPVRNL